MVNHYLKLVIAVILLSFLLICGCTSDQTKNRDNGSTDENGDISDPCGNAVGNGYEIISGPDIDAFEGDIDNPFRSLTIHPADPDIILVGTEGNGFVKSSDGGNTWVRLRLDLRHSELGYPEIYDIAWSESNPDIIYAATTGGPGPVTGMICSEAGIYKSVDGGETWTRKNCNVPCSAILSVYVDPENEDHAFVGIEDGKSSGTGFDFSDTFFTGGMYETNNGGETWELVDLGPFNYKNTYVLFRLAKSANTLINYGLDSRYDPFSEEDIGFIKSVDGGSSWVEFAPDLKSIGVSYFDISSDGSKIYVVADGVIYTSNDGGDTWTSKDMETGALYFITVSPVDKNRILYGKGADLYLSTDALTTEKKVIEIERIEDMHFTDIVFAPSDPNIVYAITTGTYPSTSGYNLYKSTDAGESFIKIANLRDDVLNVIP